MSCLNDPERLRVRAQETRAVAERETDVAVKVTMLTIAAEYEQLAERLTEDSRSGTMRKDCFHKKPLSAWDEQARIMDRHL